MRPRFWYNRRQECPQFFYRTYFKLEYDEKYKILQYDSNLVQKHFGDSFIEYYMEFFKSGLTRIIKIWL